MVVATPVEVIDAVQDSPPQSKKDPEPEPQPQPLPPSDPPKDPSAQETPTVPTQPIPASGGGEEAAAVEEREGGAKKEDAPSSTLRHWANASLHSAKALIAKVPSCRKGAAKAEEESPEEEKEEKGGEKKEAGKEWLGRELLGQLRQGLGRIGPGRRARYDFEGGEKPRSKDAQRRLSSVLPTEVAGGVGVGGDAVGDVPCRYVVAPSL